MAGSGLILHPARHSGAAESSCSEHCDINRFAPNSRAVLHRLAEGHAGSRVPARAPPAHCGWRRSMCLLRLYAMRPKRSGLGNLAVSPKSQRDQDRRIRREIANSNERRRMQSINADGEKLSKKCHHISDSGACHQFVQLIS
uniref:BHLH domain-containing protein n=1 Tax=Eptatretus burgeri TaxID=7764 RepID=A0A8C4Q4S9_EPTBU